LENHAHVHSRLSLLPILAIRSILSLCVFAQNPAARFAAMTPEQVRAFEIEVKEKKRT
jgi:hypothetical protein